MIALAVAFVSGAIGFFIFDAYRGYQSSILSRSESFKLLSPKAVLGRFIVYIAAGMFGWFVNIDILADWLFSGGPSGSHLIYAGVASRAFAVGALGPAGIRAHRRSQYGTDLAEDGNVLRVEELQVKEASVLDYVRYYMIG